MASRTSPTRRSGSTTSTSPSRLPPLGVDDILYDYVRRPDGPLDSMRFPGLRGRGPRLDRLAFLAETRKAPQPTGRVPRRVRLRGRRDAARRRRAGHRGDGARAGLRLPDALPVALGRRASTAWQARTTSRTRSSGDRWRTSRCATYGTGARLVPWLQDFSLGVEYGPAEVEGPDRGGAGCRRAGLPAVGSRQSRTRRRRSPRRRGSRRRARSRRARARLRRRSRPTSWAWCRCSCTTSCSRTAVGSTT